MEALLIIVFAVLGLVIGSFLNVCIDRLPAGRSLVSPPSFCDACQQRLSARDLIPVFSYLWLRGRCRYCEAHIPQRILWVEVGTALLLAFLYWYYGLTPQFAITAFYCCIFIIIMAIDIEHQLILNKVVYPSVGIALVLSIFFPESAGISLPWPAAVNGIIAGAMGFVLLLIPALVFRGGMGFGDVKMAALIGLVTGFPGVFVALFVGIVLGGLVAIFLLLTRMKQRKDPIPFGPFLALATMATLLYGGQLLDHYLSLLRYPIP